MRPQLIQFTHGKGRKLEAHASGKSHQSTTAARPSQPQTNPGPGRTSIRLDAVEAAYLRKSLSLAEIATIESGGAL